MRSRILPLLLVLAAACAAYATSLPGGFVYDDAQIIVANPRVTDPARMSEVWTTPYWGGRLTGGLYRPLTVFSFALNHRVASLEPLAWHVVNVLLHALVSILLFLCALEFLSPAGALAAALLFAVHPVHTEAVANLVGRAELLAAAGFLAAWLLHDRRRTAAATVFAAGLLAKEIAVVLPAALLLRDLLRRRRIDLRAYALYAAVLVGYLAARYAVLGAFTNPKGMILYRMDNVIATLPFLSALWTALSVFGRYVVLLVFPWRLSADYSWPQIDAAAPGDAWAWFGTACVLGLAVAFVGAFRAARREGAEPRGPASAMAVGLGLFGLTLFPVSNFVIRIGTVMAERLLYLPSAGFLLAVAGAGMALAGRSGAADRRAAVAVVALLGVAGTATSLVRNRDWADDATLARATVRSSPRSGRAHYNLGVNLHDQGRVEEAIASLQTAVSLDPTYTEAWVNLGGYRMSLGRVEEARRDLRAAIASDSSYSSAWITLGGLEVNSGNHREAVALLERAVARDSTIDLAWFNLGLARLGVADTTGAVRAFRRAAALNPADADAHNSLAWYLLLSGGDLDEALSHAERAVALQPDAATLDTLAEIHLRMGRRREARETWNRALRYPGDADRVRARLSELNAAGQAGPD